MHILEALAFNNLIIEKNPNLSGFIIVLLQENSAKWLLKPLIDFIRLQDTNPKTFTDRDSKKSVKWIF